MPSGFVRIDKTALDRLRKHADAIGAQQSVLVSRAVLDYLARSGTPETPAPATRKNQKPKTRKDVRHGKAKRKARR